MKTPEEFITWLQGYLAGSKAAKDKSPSFALSDEARIVSDILAELEKVALIEKVTNPYVTGVPNQINPYQITCISQELTEQSSSFGEKLATSNNYYVNLQERDNMFKMPINNGNTEFILLNGKDLSVILGTNNSFRID